MNNKQKNIALLVGSVLSLFVIYQLAIKKTVASKKAYTELQKEKNLLDNASERIKYLKQKNNYLDSILKKNDVAIYNSFQQTLLKKISDFSSEQNIEIQSFNEPHISSENQTTKETYSFSVKSDFISILQLINHLEKQRLGELISIHFEKKKNYRTRKDYLVATLYLQKMKR